MFFNIVTIYDNTYNIGYQVCKLLKLKHGTFK